MWSKQKGKPLNVQRKNRWKAAKTVLQVFALLWLGWLIYSSVFHTKAYVEPERSAWSSQDGFIAISYFGVNRSGTAKLMDQKVLEEHLRTLSDQGYVTISQQDILDYYKEGKPLPAKALFLAFEDGRNDSALYAQPILEDLSYKATMMTYAEKMEKHERKFLRPKDLKKMLKSGHWELGTNGYRLSYINIFDYEGRFMGVMDDSELKKQQDIEKIAYYNHYLMDMLRDDNMIPVENRDEMFERIDRDYELLEEAYIKTFGEVPRTYMIMHANSIYGGMNHLVEEANVRNIERLFPMHFNREGSAYNSGDESVYNLTRMQAAPYWPTNHLLMKIRKDTGDDVQFVVGERKQAEHWQIVSGAAQFKDERIIVTSPPGEEGLLRLAQSVGMPDFRLTADLTGNVVGQQSIYVRYDRENDSYVRVRIHDNRLIVEQKAGRQMQPETIYDQELGEVYWRSEDLAFDKASVYTREQTSSGAEIEYDDEGEYPDNIRNTRKMDITVRGDRLTVAVDNEVRLDAYPLDERLSSGGGVALAAEYSEMHKKDDIYDAIFERVTLQALDEAGEAEKTVYSNRLTGLERIGRSITGRLDALVDWAIAVF